MGWLGEPAARLKVATQKQAVNEPGGGVAMHIQEMHVLLALKPTSLHLCGHWPIFTHLKTPHMLNHNSVLLPAVFQHRDLWPSISFSLRIILAPGTRLLGMDTLLCHHTKR